MDKMFLKLLFGECDMCYTSLWVDDTRPIPSDCGPEWTSARTAYEALLKLELLQFESVSLDHDLATFVGNVELTGYDILMWLVERKMRGEYVPPNVKVHCANPVGRQKMQQVISQHWPLQ